MQRSVRLGEIFLVSLLSQYLFFSLTLLPSRFPSFFFFFFGYFHRWGGLNIETLKFSAIYGGFERDPPSGSSPSDWFREAKSVYFAEKKKAFKAEEAWEVLRFAPKWKNEGAPQVISPTAALDPDCVKIEIGGRPIGQKAAKKAKRVRDDESQSSLDDRQAVIDRGQDLLEKRVQAQEEANRLTAEMLQLETRTRERQGIIEDAKFLSTDTSAFDDESLAIFSAMKKILAGKYL